MPRPRIHLACSGRLLGPNRRRDSAGNSVQWTELRFGRAEPKRGAGPALADAQTSCADKVMSIYIGIGGWTYEPWRGNFYPKGLSQKRELEYASSRLTAIEINGTYYGSQKPESFRKWHDETPKDFVFTVKGPRFATNRRVLAEAGDSIQRFFASGVTELKDKLGPVNWQFMATKKFDPADFEAFLKLLPKKVDGRAVRHAVEVRHDSFKDKAFIALCRK